jgi:enoyl-CoA hydratase/carnithine racemase
MLRDAVGAARALELAASARPVTADEAIALGLALDGRTGSASELAATLLSVPDHALRETVALLGASDPAAGREALARLADDGAEHQGPERVLPSR